MCGFTGCFVFGLTLSCTFTGTAALLRDWVRARGEGAGLVLTVNCPISTGTQSTVVRRVVETLRVSVGALFIHTVGWRS